MKKTVKLFIFFLVVFSMSFIYRTSVYASYTGRITGNKISFRNGYTSGSGRQFYLYSGDLITVLDDTRLGVSQDCSKGFVKANHQGVEGYVCANYFEAYIPSAACKQEVLGAGFPNNYVDVICSLKELHNNWSFIPVNTGLDYATVVEKESACGKNLIKSSAKAELKDPTCTANDADYVAVSKKAVAYYMDPRNYICEQYVFMFESLLYENPLKQTYLTASTNILKNAEFYKYHINKGNDIASILNNAGKFKNVNPIFLSSRMKNELGVSTSEYDLYSGIYEGHNKEYFGYYNFYNIGVSGECVKENGRAYCGLSTAKKKGWNSVDNAVGGGAEFLASSYIAAGQYTSYLQKFNVVPTSSNNLFIHQYMTNIQAPMSEAQISYDAYKSANMLSNNFVFKIPVYNNMDAVINNSPNGATGDNSQTVTNTDFNTIINAAGYKTKDNAYITGISQLTNINDIKSKIEAVGSTVEIIGTTGDYIGTGSVIKVTNSSGTKEYTVLIKGDTSGDGQINALDLLQVQKNILRTYNLEGVKALAGDTSGDGQINALDLLQVQKSILRTYNIEQ